MPIFRRSRYETVACGTFLLLRKFLLFMVLALNDCYNFVQHFGCPGEKKK